MFAKQCGANGRVYFEFVQSVMGDLSDFADFQLHRRIYAVPRVNMEILTDGRSSDWAMRISERKITRHSKRDPLPLTRSRLDDASCLALGDPRNSREPMSPSYRWTMRRC